LTGSDVKAANELVCITRWNHSV